MFLWFLNFFVGFHNGCLALVIPCIFHLIYAVGFVPLLFSVVFPLICLLLLFMLCVFPLVFPFCVFKHVSYHSHLYFHCLPFLVFPFDFSLGRRERNLISPSHTQAYLDPSFCGLCFVNFDNLCSFLFLPDEWNQESSTSNKQCWKLSSSSWKPSYALI